MAEDAILRETKQSIDRLFAQVSGGAGSASQGLYDVSRAAGRADDSLEDFASGVTRAGRAAGGFESAVSTMEAAAAGYDTKLSASVAKLREDVSYNVNDFTEKLNVASGSVGVGAGLLMRSLGSMATGFKGFMSLLKSGRPVAAIAGMTKAAIKGKFALLAVSAAVVGLEDYVDDSYKTWKFLSKAGITLEGDLHKVGTMAGRTRLDFADLGTALAKGSQALAKMGGMADFGAESLVDLQEAMMSTVEGYETSGQSYAKTMKMMGVAPQESMTLLTELMGDQVFASKLRGMQDGQDAMHRSEITADYIAQLDQLSKLTGKSREQLAKEMKQKAQDAQFAATLLNMDVDQAAAAKQQLAFIENTYGKDASDLFKARLAGVVPTGAGAKTLMATSLGGVINDMAAETASAGGAAASGILTKYMGELGASAADTRDMLIPLALAGGLVGSSFASLFTATNEATIKNQAILDKMGFQITAMDNLSAAMTTAYDRTLGVFIEGGKRIYNDATRLLQSKVALDMIVDLAGTAVHEWMTGYGREGAPSTMAGAGWGMDAVLVGLETILSGFETSMMMRIEGPAVGGGTDGGGYGSNIYHPDWLSNILNPTAAGPSTQEQLVTELDRRGVGQAILGGQTSQAEVLAQVQKQLEMSANQSLDAQQAINAIVSKEARRVTGKSQAELALLQYGGAGEMGGMPSQVKTIEEVTSKVLADRLKTKLDGDQEDTAKLFYAPIVKVLKEQLALMKPGTGQQYASKGAGANPASWTPGAILDGEANQVASANLPGEAVGISVASASRVDRGWDASGNI